MVQGNQGSKGLQGFIGPTGFIRLNHKKKPSTHNQLT